MLNKLIKKIFKDFSYFIWLFVLVLVCLLSFSIYSNNKKQQKYLISNSLDNIYLIKTVKELTTNLKPRYVNINYISKQGDTYESIISNIGITSVDKKTFLKSIKQKKDLKILGINQKFQFKIDKLNSNKLIEFKIETDKKNQILFTRNAEDQKFTHKTLKKNLRKEINYKEAVISNSLYTSAVDIGIKPNIIIEFARLYGFQVDFQRDIWKDDSFQIIFEEFVDNNGNVIDTGNIIFANLNLRDTDLQLYRYEYEKNKYDFFDENGKSIKKTLMKTPINGARLSSPFGKRKHPILGYNKLHTGTDFAAPMGTPIMASGDGIVTRARWCGGGGNCVKIKHNSTYQTVYAHMSKFAKGIKKGARVKQGQIIGYVGSTGLSTGPHLHYEVIENGKKINSQKLKLPSGKILKGKERKNFEVSKIKIDVLKSELIYNLN
tara:strand:- start:170 stop:1471 length:1302 start_codon:yes stop_codon:yes gene_type:complete